MWPTIVVIVLALVAIVPFVTGAIRRRLIVVQDYQIALRVRYGRVVGRLESGLRLRHFGEVIEVTDSRTRTLTLGTQEVTTKDSQPVKASACIEYRVIAPEVTRGATAELDTGMYRFVQIALRDAVSTCELEALLADRTEVSSALKEQLMEEVKALGLEIERAVVLDVLVRGELKSALSDVVKARAEARAKLERARGETAVLRNLANAAKMIREHGGLYELRTLEAAQQAAASSSNTLVLGLERKPPNVS